jgi:hypothetical protein
MTPKLGAFCCANLSVAITFQLAAIAGMFSDWLYPIAFLVWAGTFILSAKWFSEDQT